LKTRKKISREIAMRKFVTLVFIVLCMAYIAACGGSSSKTSNVTIYNLPTPVASAPSTQALLGGAVQGKDLQLDPQVAKIVNFAGGSAGFSNFSSVGSATFNRPIAVTTDGTNLYVADYYNNVIRQINTLTKHVTTIAGNTLGLAGSVDGNGVAASFNRPSGITTDGTNLYVTDSFNYTIRKIEISSSWKVTTIAGVAGVAGSVDAAGIVDAAGNKTGGANTDARFNELHGITTDGSSLYVTDANNTIRRIVINTWDVSTLAGAPGTTGSDDGAPAAARFYQPARLTTDGPNLYVTDYGNSTIRKIALATGSVTTIAGKVGPGGVAGSHADSTSPDGPRFNQPNGITCDGSNLYVTDSYDNMVRKIVLSTGTVTTLATNGSAAVNQTMGITADGTSLFITDFSADNLNHRILRVIK
jgi:sugar lactone lactonase YvrE